MDAHCAALLQEGMRSFALSVYFSDARRISSAWGLEGIHEVREAFLAAVEAKARLVLGSSAHRADDGSIVILASGGENAARVLTERLGSTTVVRVRDRQLHLSTSAGLAFSDQDGQFANLALAAAGARNCPSRTLGEVAHHCGPTCTTGSDLLDLEDLLGTAVAEDGFVLRYQPQFDLLSGEIVGAEALIRWNHESDELEPAHFLGVLEDSGMILRVGGWVLEEACREAARWQEGGLPVPVAVNISAQQLVPELVDHVELALGGSLLPARQLELEFTETAALADPAAAYGIAGALRDLGVKISLDDFGTGHSSLTHLRRLAPSRVKIDKSFVRAIADRRERTIIGGTIELAHELGCVVVAEGVETSQHLRLLTQMGCDVGQGFLLGRPQPADDLVRYKTSA